MNSILTANKQTTLTHTAINNTPDTDFLVFVTLLGIVLALVCEAAELFDAERGGVLSEVSSGSIAPTPWESQNLVSGKQNVHSHYDSSGK